MSNWADFIIKMTPLKFRMMEKITLNEVERNLPSTDSPSKLRGISSSGGSVNIPAKNFVKEGSKSVVRWEPMNYNTLVTIVNKISGWTRFAALCIIGHSNIASSAEVRITGTYDLNLKIPVISAVVRGNMPKAVKFLYKLENDRLSIFAHCTTVQGSPCPFLCISSSTVLISTEDDISTYTEIALTTD